MSYQYGALKTAPMECAQGKFDLLDWENYQLGEDLELPISVPFYPLGSMSWGRKEWAKEYTGLPTAVLHQDSV